MKDAKGHGSNPRGTAAGYAGRDQLGRTYTQAIRDHDRFPAQNPNLPNAEDYATQHGIPTGHLNSQGHAYGSPEAINDFTKQYGGPRDHAAEGRSFNRGWREINRLARQGK